MVKGITSSSNLPAFCAASALFWLDGKDRRWGILTLFGGMALFIPLALMLTINKAQYPDDKVVRLPRWSAAELRKLIERRTKRSGIDPDFSQMIDEGVFRFEGDLTPLALVRESAKTGAGQRPVRVVRAPTEPENSSLSKIFVNLTRR